MRRIGLGALLASLLFVPLLISAGNPLLARIEILEAELDKQLVVVDGNGLEVGVVIDTVGGGGRAYIGLSVGGVPSGRLRVSNNSINSGDSPGLLSFVSDDCSGTPFITIWDTNRVVAPSFAFADGSGAFLATDVVQPSAFTFFASRLNEDGFCESQTHDTLAVPAVEVPDWSFTPPFEVIARGDLLAE